MRSFAITLALGAALAGLAGPAAAQTPTQSTQPPATTVVVSDEVHTRPATTTFMGDTGLWYRAHGRGAAEQAKWSVSAYRVNFD